MLNYREAGSGVPLVLIHAFPLSSEAFWPQLKTPIAGVRLIAPDLRGFGQSGPGTGVMTMESMADDVLTLMTSLDLPNAFIGGVSMGGYVAMALTRRDPGRVKGLVLVDTQQGADDEAGKAKRETTARDIETKGMPVLVDSMMPKLLAPLTSHEVRARVEKIMLETSPGSAAGATRGMVLRTDSKDILARFGGPALVVVGESDSVTSVEKAKAMAEVISGAKLEVISGASHLSNLDQPAAFNAALERFFAAHLQC